MQKIHKLQESSTIIYRVKIVNTNFHHLDKRFCPLKKNLELIWCRYGSAFPDGIMETVNRISAMDIVLQSPPFLS